ncbi:hypothetical protein diail_11600 [Diaporthe ilicicola]|nr:hypothetical protein diail_11600 [Diaporthe ilicicola]
MASLVHPAGIWTVPSDENTGSGHTKDATSTRQAQHACTQDVDHTLSQDAITTANDPGPSAIIELVPIRSLRHGGDLDASSTGLAQEEERGGPRTLASSSQGVPAELQSLVAEVVFVLTCSGGQLVAALLIGHVAVTQAVFTAALGIPPSQAPWLLGASMLPCGLSVVISGSLADLAPPKPMMVGAFLWEAVWNVVAAVAISPKLKALFFVARAMQGLAAGVLVSASMSILGRVYSPGIRKTRVFSLMAAGSPFGYWLGCLLAGALSSRLPWIFGTSAVLMAVLTVAAQLTIPSLRPASDELDTEAPSLRQFDYVGAALASLGCGAWQWYAIQFWQRYQGASPLTTALYLLPNGLVGILAAYVVSKTLHVVPTHVIFTASMIAFGLGPVFFLPQTPASNYWALSMPGVALATFGPDMSFAAAAIFITSSVPRSYQGAAGSLLVTVQNLTVAVMTSISAAVGARVDTALPGDDVGLGGIKAIWWFGLAASLVGALITVTMVRIPRAEEKEHVH